MKALRILAGVAILALAAPLLGRADTASAAPLGYSIHMTHSAPWTTTMHSVSVTVQGVTGGVVGFVHVDISKGTTTSGIRFRDWSYGDYGQYYGKGTASGTVQFTPMLPSSPLYVVTLNVTATLYNQTATIIGRGIIDKVHQKLLGGAFTVAISGGIGMLSSSPPYTSEQDAGFRTGTISETIHLPAYAQVSLGTLR